VGVGCAVPVRAAKQRVVLASLLADPGRVVTVDQLITRLWATPYRMALRAPCVVM
jgi:DNA-binding SARP family transcriptional activator